MADDAQNIFKVFDKDFDGKLQALEMHQALGAANLCPSIEDVQLVLKEAGGGGGDMQMFLKLLQQFQNTKPTAQSLPPLFKVVDPSNSGRVEVASLRYLLTNFNEKLSDLEASEFFEMLKLPSSGQVEIAEISSKLQSLLS
ncbi:hypothetical protein Efla_000447 [Eimeria flavescens]